MKRAINTLAALLAFSSTAVAEDWSTISTLPEDPNNPYCYEIDGGTAGFTGPCAGARSQQYTLSFGGIGTTWMTPFWYDWHQFYYGPVPPEIARSVYTEGTEASGIPIPNGAVITARCGSLHEPANYSLPSQVLTTTTCAPAVIGGTYQIPISAFARSDTVSALAGDVAALEQRILDLETTPLRIATLEADLQDARREADEGSAMAAAMTTVAPADGKANRIGFNTATYNGSTAVAVSYSRAAGDVDFNVGVAMAGDNAMVKAGAGFSW